MSLYKSASEAIITTIPLNDDDLLSNNTSKPLRKSTPRRRATPKPTKSRKRVLEVVENEASQRYSSAKRSKHYDDEVSISQERSSAEADEGSALRLDDLVDATITDSTDKIVYEDRPTDGTAHNRAPLSTGREAIDTSRQAYSSRSSRSTSPFKFKRNGQESSVSRTDLPSLNNAKARRKLLISDLVEPRQEFDSIIEAEDFSMVPLSSVSSAQQHLSLRRETNHVTNTGTEMIDRTSRQLRSGLRSQTASPTKVAQSKNVRSKQTGLQMPVELAANDTQNPFSPRRSPRRQPVSTISQRDDSPARTRGPARYNNVNYSANTVPVITNSIEEEIQELSPAPPNIPELPTVIQDVEDEIEEDHELGKNSGSLDDLDAPILDLEEADENALKDDEPIYLTHEETLHTQPQHESSPQRNGSNANNRRSGPQEQVEHVPSENSTLRKIGLEHNQVDGLHDESRIEQSSMLRLPNGRETRSKIFSSPVLPDTVPWHTKPNTNSSQKKVKTPQLKRVVRAGKALQDVVEPSLQQRTQTTPEADLGHVSGDQSEGLFSGFSMATRRELRAGLRLGHELAKRQSSFVDTTMHTVSDQAERDEPRKTDVDVLQRKSAPFEPAGINTNVAYPVLFGQENTQLPSPEISSNSTESKVEQAPVYSRKVHDISSVPGNAQERIPHVFVQTDAHKDLEDDSIHEQEDLEFQDQGFASDSEPDAGNAGNDELDIWQLAADSTSFLQESDLPMDTHTGYLDAGSDVMQPPPMSMRQEQSVARDTPRKAVPTEIIQQAATTLAGTLAPTALSDLLTPSESDVSSPMRAQGNGVEFTDFTGFTKDLLQAAANRNRKQDTNQDIREEDEEEEQEQDQQEINAHMTPADKVVQQHKKYPVDVFTTRSFLETSPASAKPKRYSPKKVVSFRPSNRKASWLFDPSRLRKPPSPLKQVYPTAVSLLLDPINQASSEDGNEPQGDEQHMQNPLEDVASVSYSSGEEQGQARPRKKPRPAANGELSHHRELSPVPRIVATSPKDEAEHSLSDATPLSDNTRSSPPSNRFAKNNATRDDLFKDQYSTTARDRSSVTPRFQSSSVVQLSEPVSQQSSFISNATSNTSYEIAEPQTWMSLLSSVTTPLLTSTKVATNLAVTAFRRSQRKTFYPERKPAGSTSTILTRHNPFNDAHWSTLRIFYVAAQEQPDRHQLDLRDPCADYLGLEIESLGWKRELKEWELAVVARFLVFLEEEGVVEDDEQDVITAEDVVKRVFSLWVGMVTRGEVELTDGVAGAWDRRFVSRRDAVLAKQKVWQQSVRQ